MRSLFFVWLITKIFALTEEYEHKICLRLLCLAILAVVFLDAVIFFQFTAVAEIVAATAIFLMVSWDEKSDSIYSYVFCCILYIVSALIRKKVFWMNLPVFAIVAAWGMFRGMLSKSIAGECKKRWLRSILPYLLVIVVGAGIICSCEIIENYVYSSEEWSEYRKYKTYRAQIVDYAGWPVYEGNEEFWEALDITQEEHSCIKMFGILQDIDSDKLQKIAAVSKASVRTVGWKAHLLSMWEIFSDAVGNKNYRGQYLLFLACIILLCCNVRKCNKLERVCIFAVFSVSL